MHLRDAYFDSVNDLSHLGCHVVEQSTTKARKFRISHARRQHEMVLAHEIRGHLMQTCAREKLLRDGEDEWEGVLLASFEDP